jgi:ribose transport system substrate-binding protein
VALSEAAEREACDRRFSVAIVFHTLDGDWSKQSLAGIVSTLSRCGVTVSEVVDCKFDPASQIEALARISGESVDAVVSIPVANAAVASAHRAVCESGKRLILHDNVPTGLVPGRDYTSLVSADNFGLGLIGAELLASHVTAGRNVGLLTFGVDFYATNEREIAFGRWMKTNRPDLHVHTRRFSTIETAARATDALLDDCLNLAGLFVVWDVPAMQAIATLQRRHLNIPVTTVDLGREASISLAGGGPIVGIAAQQPHAQGVAVAQSAILAMLGQSVPMWVALPGLPVEQANVAERYRRVWGAAAPV